MKKFDYLKMLIQDNETEAQPKKELHEAVIECTIEALSQSGEETEVDQAVGLGELYKIIEDVGRKSQSKCVSPFAAAELIAKRLGVEYKRPFDVLKAKFCGGEMRVDTPRRARIDLDDL